jgi:hypothetical protein
VLAPPGALAYLDDFAQDCDDLWPLAFALAAVIAARNRM